MEIKRNTVLMGFMVTLIDESDSGWSILSIGSLCQLNDILCHGMVEALYVLSVLNKLEGLIWF